MKAAQRGVSLAMVLALVVLLEGLCALAAIATMARVRLAGDERRGVESWLVSASALAETRVAQDSLIAAMADGERVPFGWTVRPDGWRWRADLVRDGLLYRLEVLTEQRDADSLLRASRRRTLLLSRLPSDTVRVLAHRARM
jgi:hypothetical protein